MLLTPFKRDLFHILFVVDARRQANGLELLIDKPLSGFRPYGSVLGVPLAGALVLERRGFAVFGVTFSAILCV